MFKPPRGFFRRLSAAAQGEPWVWLCAAGLIMSLVLVIGLFVLIASRALPAFWPQPVALLELRESGALAGRIVQKYEKQTDGVRETYFKVYVGNKAVHGKNFVHVNERELLRVSYPEDMLYIDSLDGGDIFGQPQSLTLQGGLRVPVDDPRFEDFFAQLVTDTAVRRIDILEVELGQLGELNRHLEQNARRLRVLAKNEIQNAAEIGEISAAQKKLQTRHEVYARKSKELHERQDHFTLGYRVASGQSLVMPMEKIDHYYYPNRLGFFEKADVFMQNIWRFLSEAPRQANMGGGVFPAIFGTLVMTVLMSAAVAPLGVLVAVYLHEYARPGLFSRLARAGIYNLAGVPSIIFGVIGLCFFVHLAGGTLDQLFFADALPTPTFGTGGILWASLTLALMTLPVVVVATEQALHAVPRSVREASMACGASQWQSLRRVVLPAAVPGMLTGLILAMARGAGEVAPLMLVGVVKLAPSLPVDAVAPFVHLERKFMHLGYHMYDLGAQSPDIDAALPLLFACILTLVLLVGALNFLAVWMRARMRKKYAVKPF